MLARLPLSLLLVLAAAAPAPAEHLARCKRACVDAVSACVAAAPYKPRKAARRCKAKLHRDCRRLGTSACDVTPATTTTTTVRTIDTLPPTTEPPVTVPPTTSTTLPPVRSYAGTWYFRGSLTTDTCGSSFGLADSFTIVQSATSLSATIGSYAAARLTGSVTVEGFELSGIVYDGGCSIAIALVARNDGVVVLSAATGFDISCFGESCRSIWVGTLAR